MKPTTADAFKLLLDGSLALAKVEANGIRINVPYLDNAIKETASQIAEVEKKLRADPVYKVWRKVFGDRANLGSREQIGRVLFVELGHESKEKTATGRNKVDVSSLAGIDIPFVKDYGRLEKMKKMKSTYLEGIKREVVDGFLHPSFNLNTVETFRSSSSNPNFQNIPIRDVGIGETIRKMFVPRKGRALVEIDYGGIEVRVAACYHKDPNMLEYIRDPSRDMHRDMAAEIFCLEENEVNKLTRYVGKNMFVFPEFYGAFYVDCARNMWDAIDRMKLKVGNTETSVKERLKERGITSPGELDETKRPRPGTFEHHVKKVEDDFWGRRFSAYRDWKERWWKAYRKRGSFRMLTGFKCSGVHKRNEVINYPVQGSAFHCLLWSLIRIQKWVTKNRMRTKLVGQIHDSILADVPESELRDYLTNAKRIMTESLPKAWPWIIVPLEVEADASFENWHAKRQWSDASGTWKEVAK